MPSIKHLVLISRRDSGAPPALSEPQQHLRICYITSHSSFLVITEKDNDHSAEVLCILKRFKCDGFLWNPYRLKRRKQLKPSQSEKNANEQNPAIISCPGVPKDNDANKKADLQRISSKSPAGSGQSSMRSFPGCTHSGQSGPTRLIVKENPKLLVCCGSVTVLSLDSCH